MQFSGNFKGKTPYFEHILGSGPPLGSKLCLPPTKILDPRLRCHTAVTEITPKINHNTWVQPGPCAIKKTHIVTPHVTVKYGNSKPLHSGLTMILAFIEKQVHTTQTHHNPFNREHHWRNQPFRLTRKQHCYTQHKTQHTCTPESLKNRRRPQTRREISINVC